MGVKQTDGGITEAMNGGEGQDDYQFMMLIEPARGISFHLKH